MRPLFRLGPRLALCADFVEGGRPLCDVGTDHAYLPIWLLKSGRIPSALACDINPGPLETAAANARRYRVEDRLTLRQSDGLRGVAPGEAGEIVMAGMGGDLILRMVAETPWLRQEGVGLVLQPMSSARELRVGLRELGFAILRESAVEDAGRVYTACAVRWVGQPPETGPLYPWLGKLEPGGEAARRCAEKALRDLDGRLEGARRGRGEDSPQALEEAACLIRQIFLGEDA